MQEMLKIIFYICFTDIRKQKIDDNNKKIKKKSLFSCGYHTNFLNV